MYSKCLVWWTFVSIILYDLVNAKKWSCSQVLRVSLNCHIYFVTTLWGFATIFAPFEPNIFIVNVVQTSWLKNVHSSLLLCFLKNWFIWISNLDQKKKFCLWLKLRRDPKWKDWMMRLFGKKNWKKGTSLHILKKNVFKGNYLIIIVTWVSKIGLPINWIRNECCELFELSLLVKIRNSMRYDEPENFNSSKRWIH